MDIPRIGDSPQSQSFYAHFGQLAEGSTREKISRQFQVAPKIRVQRPDRPASRQMSWVEARRNVVASDAPASPLAVLSVGMPGHDFQRG
jgi:hypothetical protein